MDPFVAEIRIFPFHVVPTGWAKCDGQLLPLSQNTALYSILGTTYGGNGTSTFALPDLRERVPLHAGTGPGLRQRTLGEHGGTATVTLLQTQLPTHTHQAYADNTPGASASPTGRTWAIPRYGRALERNYSTGTGDTMMHPSAIAPEGSTSPHNNLPPYLTVNFCIALQGIFPPRP